MAAHPDDHEGDDPDRREPDHGLQLLLLALRKLLVEELQGDTHRGAQADCDRDPDPDVPKGLPLALLAQERRDDPDDQRRFEALAEPDHVCGDQALSNSNPIAAVGMAWHPTRT